jgi:hypothetical protein
LTLAHHHDLTVTRQGLGHRLTSRSSGGISVSSK